MTWNESDCTPWGGYITDQGYGRVMVSKNKARSAHVIEWEKENGPVPEGMVLDHLCRNRACVNTAHLEVVTPKENTLRGEGPTAVNARKEHCKHGHPLSGENLIIDYRERRKCRTCQNRLNSQYKARKRAKKRALKQSQGVAE